MNNSSEEADSEQYVCTEDSSFKQIELLSRGYEDEQSLSVAFNLVSVSSKSNCNTK